MTTPLLSMSHRSNWCHSAVVSATATTSFNTGNVSFKGRTSNHHNGNFVMPSTFAKSTSTMSLPSTAIFLQKIGCSMSLPILYSDKMTPTNDNLNDNSTTNEDSDSLLASSLPNLKFFDKKFQEISQRLDSIDLYKDKNEFVEPLKNETITNDNEIMDQQGQENLPKNSRVDSLDIYKRRRSSTELDLAIVEKYLSDKDKSIVSDESNETTIEDDLARLKIEMNKSNNINSMDISTSSLDDEKWNRRGERKNSSMVPILPDLELISKLREGDNDAVYHDHLQRPNYIHNDQFDETTLNNVDKLETSLSNVDDLKNDNIADVYDESESDQNEKTSNLNQYRTTLFKSGTNKKQETAAAWLAAATQQLSDQINQLNNRKLKNEESAYTESLDVDVSKPNRKKKTSILRTKSLSIHYEKKNVRFADTLGHSLENVRYFMLTPQIPPRRYSSYTPPLNNEWNSDSWHGTGDNMKTNSMQNNTRFSSIPSMKRDYLNNTMNLNPRYELVIANFTIPSLSLDFSRRLFERKVILHSLTMAETTVYGNVSVENVHFVKKVFVRYTFDEWKTFIEREATYMPGSHDGHTDKFSFVIYARPQDFNLNHYHYHSSPFYHQIKPSNKSNNEHSHHNESITKMFFAIRFTTGDGQEFWDNNDGLNYQLDLKPF